MSELRLHIATLGLHANERVPHVVMNRGADKVVIIHSERNEEEAKDQVRDFVSSGMNASCVRVNPWNYEEVLATIIRVIVEHPEYDEVELNGSCGTRVMTAATYMAAVLVNAPVWFVTDEPNPVNRRIIEARPVSISKLTEPKEMIFRRLLDAGGHIDSQRELGSRTHLRAHSISKHLRELEDLRYIRRQRRGRTTSVDLTPLGEIVLRLKILRQKESVQS